MNNNIVSTTVCNEERTKFLHDRGVCKYGSPKLSKEYYDLNCKFLCLLAVCLTLYPMIKGLSDRAGGADMQEELNRLLREDTKQLQELGIKRSPLDSEEIDCSMDILSGEQKEDYIYYMKLMHDHVKQYLAPWQIVDDPDWHVTELSTRYDLL